MKLLVVSHPCVRPVNQQFYAAVERLTGWTLTLAAPARWRDEYGVIEGLERWPSFRGALRSIPVWLPGHIPLHLYRARLTSLFREVNPDVVYVHHEPYAVATAQAYLANAHSLGRPIGFYSAQNIVKRYLPPFRWTEQMVYESSSFAFPVSHSVEETLRAKGYRAEATVLPLAVNPELYAPQPDRSALRDQWCRRSDEVVLGYVGRLAEEKGIKTMFKALNQLGDVPWRQVMVGVGEDEAEYRALADTLGIAERIEWCGYVAHTEVSRYLSAFDVLVLPSETQANWKEQFGRVLIEAMACGTPVVGSDSGEIPYVIGHTGGGIVFPEQRPDRLAQCLREMILNPQDRERLASMGRSSVLECYTEDVLAERFATIIERALVGGRAATSLA